jgi:hypothetical protein
MELEDDKYFNSWYRSIVVTTFIHHTQHVLNADYKPVTAMEIGLFKEMQIVMYAVFEDKLKTDKGKSLVSNYKTTRDT